MEPTGALDGPNGVTGTPEKEQKFHILLVEDDEVTLRTVEKLLKTCSYEVTLARNGKQALEVLEGAASGSRPAVDLILTDLHMPEVSGLELVDGVIHNDFYSSIPVVVMSCNDAPAAVLNCFEAGASDYLLKPIRRQELQNIWQHIWRHNPSRLASHRSKGGAEQQAATAGRPPQADEPSGRTLASSTHLSALKQEQPPLLRQGKAQQQAQQGGAPWPPRSKSAPPEENTSTDGSFGAATTTQQVSDGSGAAAGARAGSAREGEVPLAPGERLQEVLAAAAAAEHVVRPPAQCGSLVDLDITPLSLPPPPLFVQSKGGGSAAVATGMPRGLQKLAELGARREQLTRVASAGTPLGSAAPGSDSRASASSSLAALHHSSTSAFTHFAALVPPPCPRGGWEAVATAHPAEQAASQQQLGSAPACEPSACSSVEQLVHQQHPKQQSLQPQRQQQQQQLRTAAGPPVYPGAWAPPAAELLQQQQQRFLHALQAAIQHHQAATSHMTTEAQAHRRAAVEKFRQKRKQRTFEKKVRYESRKKLAEQRPRVRGQFVKASVAQAHAAALERGDTEGAGALLKQQRGS